MTGAETLDIARDAIWTIVVVSSPLMIVGLIVGVVVSLIQALTQIQEQTLIFVPKILAIFVTLLLALPFMADALQGHMMRISSRIIGGERKKILLILRCSPLAASLEGWKRAPLHPSRRKGALLRMTVWNAAGPVHPC